jgi:hypothetical protein
LDDYPGQRRLRRPVDDRDQNEDRDSAGNERRKFAPADPAGQVKVMLGNGARKYARHGAYIGKFHWAIRVIYLD